MAKKQRRSELCTTESLAKAYRKQFVQVVRRKTLDMNLTSVICSTALTYFDLAIQRANIENTKEEYEAFALVCLLLATKFHEACQLAPKCSILANTLRSLLTERVMKDTELRITTALGWYLDVQTPTQFVNYYIDRGRY